MNKKKSEAEVRKATWILLQNYNIINDKILICDLII